MHSKEIRNKIDEFFAESTPKTDAQMVALFPPLKEALKSLVQENFVMEMYYSSHHGNEIKLGVKLYIQQGTTIAILNHYVSLVNAEQLAKSHVFPNTLVV